MRKLITFEESLGIRYPLQVHQPLLEYRRQRLVALSREGALDQQQRGSRGGVLQLEHPAQGQHGVVRVSPNCVKGCQSTGVKPGHQVGVEGPLRPEAVVGLVLGVGIRVASSRGRGVTFFRLKHAKEVFVCVGDVELVRIATACGSVHNNFSNRSLSNIEIDLTSQILIVGGSLTLLYAVAVLEQLLRSLPENLPYRGVELSASVGDGGKGEGGRVAEGGGGDKGEGEEARPVEGTLHGKEAMKTQ